VRQKRQRQKVVDSRKGTVSKVRKRPGIQRGEGQELEWKRKRVERADRQEQREGAKIVGREKEEGTKRDGGSRDEQTIKKGQMGLLKGLARKWQAQRQDKVRELKKRGPATQEK